MKSSSNPRLISLSLAFLLIVIIFSYFAFAATITVNQPPSITNNRTPLLNITFNETVNQSWFSIDNGTNTTACYNCTNFTTILNQEFPQDTTGLVGWWKFNSVNASNYTLDESGMNNSGRLYNGSKSCFGPSDCPRLVDGKFGNALQFDGRSDYVQVDNASSLNITDAITIEVWIKPDINSNYSLYPQIANKLSTNSWHLYIYDQSSLVFRPWGLTVISVNGGSISKGVWSHGVVTYNGSIISIYVNGTNVKNTAATGTITGGDGKLKIGSSVGAINANDYFNGSIDELRVYNRSLSSDEVYNNYVLSAGQHNITIYVNDSSGNVNTSVKQFTIDVTPPVISFVNPTPNNGTLNQSWAFVNITSDENINTAILEWNGVNETMSGSNTNFNINKTWLLGNYTFRVYANDTVGNWNATETRFVIKSLSSTVNISHAFEFNGSYFILTPDTGNATFTFEAPTPSQVRVTDNTEVVINYNFGIIFKVLGWNLSYGNGNITLISNLSEKHDYIIIDYNPQQENIQTGYYGMHRNQSDADIFINSNFDWYWYISSDISKPNYAKNLTLGGKKVLLQTWWWDDIVLSSKNWTDIYNNETLFNRTIDMIRSPIDYVGNDSFYAITLSEEEPNAGYNYHGFSSTVNEEHYVNVSNRIYTKLKATYPNMKILLGTQIMTLSTPNFGNLSRDGIMDDWYQPLTTGNNNMSGWYDRLVSEQNSYDDVYALIWAGSNFAGYEPYTPIYTHDAFNLGRTKGLRNIGFFGIDNNISNISVRTRILYNDYPFNNSKPDYNRPELYKETMFKMISLYSTNDIGGIYSGAGLLHTVEPTGSITYSRNIRSIDNRTNFTVTPSSDYINVTISNFTTSYKQWNESSPNSSVTVYHEIGNFTPNTKIQIRKNGIPWNNYISNASGYINFTYDGGYSDVQFEALLVPQWFDNKTSPSSPATYSPNKAYQFNITWNDTISTVFIEHNFTGISTPHNDSFTGNVSSEYYFTAIDLPAGTYVWKSYANNTDNNWNSTPQWEYTVAINTSTVNFMNLTINGTESNKNYTYPAVTNVTAWDSITDNQNITLWRNTTFIGNSTEAITDLVQLAAGFYNYTLHYPGSQNYSSTTKQFNLTINKAPTNVTLYLNGSDSDISFGNNNTLNITAVINITGKTVYLDLNATGYGNNFASGATTVTNITNTTILGIGLYNATAHSDGDANYSASSSTHFLTITDTTFPQYSNIKEYPTDPTTYAKDGQYQFNITWTDDISINEVILEFNSINYSYLLNQISKNGNEYYKTFNDLSANPSGYLYRWHANDTTNNWQSTTQQSYIVNKANPSLSLIISPNNSTTYGTTTVANGTLITGDSNANISLYRNGTIVNSSTTLLSITETILLGSGAYNYTFAYNGTQNYTSAAVTNITVVSANSSLAVRLYLDRTEGNKTYTRGSTANITATANVTGKNVTIEANFTGSTATIANGTNNATNITDTSSLLGTYNITAYFAGDSNYTTNSTTYYLTVQALADTSSCTSSINCAGGYCVHGICRSSSTYSGDGYCDTGETCSSSPNDCGGCGGPAISISTEKGKSIITISYISSTSPKTVDTTDMNTDVTSIFISTKEAVSSVKITLEKISLPSNIPSLANVYSYINITGDKIQDKNVKQAKIAFKVSKAWIINNNINESAIALFRYDNQWNKLNTTKLSEDYTSIYFEAATPGFSIFAISGEKISVEAPPEEEIPTPAVEMPEGEIKIKPWYEIFYQWYTWVIIGVMVFIAIVWRFRSSIKI